MIPGFVAADELDEVASCARELLGWRTDVKCCDRETRAAPGANGPFNEERATVCERGARHGPVRAPGPAAGAGARGGDEVDALPDVLRKLAARARASPLALGPLRDVTAVGGATATFGWTHIWIPRPMANVHRRPPLGHGAHAVAGRPAGLDDVRPGGSIYEFLRRGRCRRPRDNRDSRPAAGKARRTELHHGMGWGPRGGRFPRPGVDVDGDVAFDWWSAPSHSVTEPRAASQCVFRLRRAAVNRLVVFGFWTRTVKPDLLRRRPSFSNENPGTRGRTGHPDGVAAQRYLRAMRAPAKLWTGRCRCHAPALYRSQDANGGRPLTISR